MASSKRKAAPVGAPSLVQTAQSSWVESFGYDAENAAFYLKTQSGKAYKYPNVPADVFERYKSMDSAGQAFNQLIKGAYTEIPIEVSVYDQVMNSAKSSRARVSKRAKKRLLWRTSGIVGWQIVPAF